MFTDLCGVKSRGARSSDLKIFEIEVRAPWWKASCIPHPLFFLFPYPLLLFPSQQVGVEYKWMWNTEDPGGKWVDRVGGLKGKLLNLSKFQVETNVPVADSDSNLPLLCNLGIHLPCVFCLVFLRLPKDWFVRIFGSDHAVSIQVARASKSASIQTSPI